MLENIKKLRLKDKISQQELGDIVGVSQQSINKYENHNVEPGLETLVKIAEYFNVSVDFLIGHTDVERLPENLTRFDLNREESKLIDGFRKLSKSEKSSIIVIIENYLNKK